MINIKKTVLALLLVPAFVFGDPVVIEARIMPDSPKEPDVEVKTATKSVFIDQKTEDVFSQAKVLTPAALSASETALPASQVPNSFTSSMSDFSDTDGGEFEPSNDVVVTTIAGQTVVDGGGVSHISSPNDFSKAESGVSFQMRPGLLKPQLIALLLNHPNIKDKSGVVWKARENLAWTNHYRVSEKNIDVVLNEILRPYKLFADFKKNNVVIISGGVQ